MEVHLIQPDIAWEDPSTSFARVHSLLSGRKIVPGSLLLLPEMAGNGFSMNVAVTAEPLDGPSVSMFRDLARRTKSYVIGGLVRRGVEQNPENQAVVLDPEGREILCYTKMHPFSLAEEDLVHAEGGGVAVCRIGDFTVAPVICYDLRFPELFRATLDHGADVMVVIANWPIARVDHWTTLLKARAIENQCYVLGVNRCGKDPSFIYPGKSAIFDPHGRCLAEAGAAEEIISATLSSSLLRDWRRAFPALRDRRNDLLPAPPPQGLDRVAGTEIGRYTHD
jgi:predicted amidohydrolase